MIALQDITFAQIMEICAVVLVLVGAYNAIMTAVKNHREETKVKNSPVTQLKERVDRHDELLQKDKDRLDEMEGRIADMNQQSTIMLRGVRALLSHEINGNSTEKLQNSMTEIDDYLIARK